MSFINFVEFLGKLRVGHGSSNALVHYKVTSIIDPPIMQVPSREHDMCPEDALTLFINDIPVLGLIGSKHLIEKDEPYSIDGDAQLVCKYLKAYKIGGRRGIDKLYRERKCSLVNNKERSSIRILVAL